MANNTPINAVSATPRTGTFNKNHARRVRVQGLIPAVVYGAGQPSVPVTVDPKVITKILYSEAGHNSIFDLNVEGSGPQKVMIVDWQNEPIKGKLLHIDMKRIAMNVAIKVSVPVQLEGTPVGVKTQDGVLSQLLHEVEIECLPADIPSHIDVAVSNLALNDAILVKDLPHAGQYKFTAAEDEMVAHVTIVKLDADVEAALETPAEPEVEKKGKQETEEAK